VWLTPYAFAVPTLVYSGGMSRGTKVVYGNNTDVSALRDSPRPGLFLQELVHEPPKIENIHGRKRRAWMTRGAYGGGVDETEFRLLPGTAGAGRAVRRTVFCRGEDHGYLLPADLPGASAA